MTAMFALASALSAPLAALSTLSDLAPYLALIGRGLPRRRLGPGREVPDRGGDRDHDHHRLDPAVPVRGQRVLGLELPVLMGRLDDIDLTQDARQEGGAEASSTSAWERLAQLRLTLGGQIGEREARAARAA